ncbi:MAG: hypothetical protein AAGN82_19665 [Myxococcota bacterium]
MTRVVFAAAAYRWLSMFIVTSPLAVAVARPFRHHPRGDAAWFDAGGVWLLETVRVMLPVAGGLGVVTLGLSLVFALGWSIPLGALVAAGRGARGTQAYADAVRCGPSLAVFQGAAILAASVLAVGAAALGTPPRVYAAGDLVRPALVLGLAGVGWWGLTVVLDAARMRRFDDDVSGALNALYEGGVTLARHPRLWVAAAGRTVIGLTSAVAAFAATQALARVGAHGGVLALVHAASGLVYVTLRTSWFRRLATVAATSDRAG